MNIAMCNSVMRELQTGRLMKLFEAKKEQHLAASAGGTRRMLKNGEVKFAIHPQFYHYWGQRLGYKCWDDRGFVHEFLRDNPECRVKSVSDRIVVGWKPGEKSRFRKTYSL